MRALKRLMQKLEGLLERGGTKKDIALLAVSGAALLLSLLDWRPLGFDLAWAFFAACASASPPCLAPRSNT